jgi:large subunit ribosomal protein L25
LPEFIEVDISALHAGQSIHAVDLKLPEGVEMVAKVRGDNPAIVAVLAPRGGGEEEEQPAETPAAAPPAA